MKTVDQETLRNWLEDADLFLMDVRSTTASEPQHCQDRALPPL